MSGEADKVELVFTKFVSLITSTPTIQTLLPLTPTGELCDVDGNCVDAAEDEIFKLTTQVSALPYGIMAGSATDAAVTKDLLYSQDTP